MKMANDASLGIQCIYMRDRQTEQYYSSQSIESNPSVFSLTEVRANHYNV